LINLGFEPQWFLTKKVTTNTTAGQWWIMDITRGLSASASQSDYWLEANSTATENGAANYGGLNLRVCFQKVETLTQVVKPTYTLLFVDLCLRQLFLTKTLTV
jgi:hypothetical protein